MAKFSIGRDNVTLSTSQDFTTIYTAAATGNGSVFRVGEASIVGTNSSSTVNRIVVQRANGGSQSTPVAIVPQPLFEGSRAADIVAASSWTTAPTLSGIPILDPSMNTFGGVYRWVAPPDSEIWVGGQNAVSYLAVFRSNSGAGTCSGHVIFEQM